MSSKIHSTATIDPGARLADDVEVGPYAVIGGHVRIGSGCRIGAHCVLEGQTTIGKNNLFFAGAVIGMIPQDKKYQGEESLLLIGDNNTFREYVTIHSGTKGGGGKTVIGSGILAMAYSHVAHDCQIGNGVVLANGVQLGGHVTVEEKVILGGLVGVPQFVRIGRLAIVGGCSKVNQDLVPFAIADGSRARVFGVNKIGLKRNGVSPEISKQLDRAFRLLFHSGLSTRSALESIEAELPKSREMDHLVQFIRTCKRGFCRGIRGRQGHAEEAPAPAWND